MPLIKSTSDKVVGKNIATESKTKPHEQAVAIALSVQDQAKKKRKDTLEAAYSKHMKGSEEKGETKKESKKAEMAE
jgi:hypothetical protein